MISASSAIPRFLLPQITWKATARQAWTVNTFKQQQSSPSALWFQCKTSSRPISTHSRIRWNEHVLARSSASFRSSHNGHVSPYLSPPIVNNIPTTPFSTTPRRPRDHHFDTLKFVQRLKDEGFSEDQSRAMMLVLSDVIEESIQNLTRTMVLREDADRSMYTQKVDFTKLRSELLALDSSDASVTLASHERLANDLAKLTSRLRDEISRAQASVRLDLNLEKGRIREEAKSQELKIKETETRIEQEVAGLRERVEGVKFSTLQWLMGVCTGTAALILGAWRLLM